MDPDCDTYTDEDIAWFDHLDEVDRDFEAGMYDDGVFDAPR